MRAGMQAAVPHGKNGAAMHAPMACGYFLGELCANARAMGAGDVGGGWFTPAASLGGPWPASGFVRPRMVEKKPAALMEYALAAL